MKITFDLGKDLANVAKHGVSLAFGARIFDDALAVIVPTIRVEDGERRMKAIGMVDARLWTAVHVDLPMVTRFISVRRSNDGAERAYRALR